MAAAPVRGKNTARRTAWRLAAVSFLLFVFVAVMLISTTTVQSRQELTSSERGSEFRAWRKDGVRPDRTTDMTTPPAPKANSNVPGGPFGR
ncbi:hypothetical protein BDA96_09G200500 [Sorghum bicolor]|uniref:Uncharacterized protein n=2 Tax=Sorghum bicolor TaxID=4558 RepID=A0A921U569_SORBI|nr:hypothetical protein BDA96_09G200500 [Sorghum bicolor]KXG22297.1 hypothetical protein SORBI_3009G189700 [Sorghum bicolor]